MDGHHDIQRTGSRGGLLGSLLIHAALVIILVIVASRKAADPPPDAPTVDIVTVYPPPTAVVVINPGPVGGTKAVGMVTAIVDPSSGRSGKRGHTTGPPAPKSADPFAEVTVSVDHGPEVGTGAGDHGTGPGRALYGNGYDGPPGNGIGGGLGGMGVPSLKRPPAPREDYSQSSEKFPEEFAGSTIVVALKLDANGHVSNAKLEHGVGDEQVDNKIVDKIRAFEFWPALDDTGRPVASTYKWMWVLQPPK